MPLQQVEGWKSSTIAQSYVEEGTHSRMQIAQRFQASTSSSSVTKRNRTVCSSSSSAANDNVWSLTPTISIGAGSSNNQIHVNIGYPPSTVTSGSSIAEEESKEWMLINNIDSVDQNKSLTRNCTFFVYLLTWYTISNILKGTSVI